ncbi:MBL fold metallo-hydrolase [Desulfonatronum parangueonense]
MNICIHRGSNQIGGSCVEIEQDGQRIFVDLGLPLDAESNTPGYLPDVPCLINGDPSLLGIFISHPHLDHLGLLKHVSPKIPVFMGPAARRILAAAKPFLPSNWPDLPAGKDYEAWTALEVGPFRITPYLVDHSAYDSYALLIEAGGKRLFYSGDFRGHGRKAKLFNNILTRPPQDIDVLLLEGSSLGRLGKAELFPTEAEIEEQLASVFATTDGLAMVHVSGQNIDRIVSILRATKRTGRKMVMDLYTAAILEATGNPNIPQSNWQDVALFVPQPQRIQIKTNAWFDQLKHHSANRIYGQHLQANPKEYTLLFRPLFMSDLDRAECLSGAAYIYSQWEGYWERGLYDHVKSWLESQGIAKQNIHTSGHAGTAELQAFVEALSPRRVVPIHSFAPDQYANLFQNVEPHSDGQWWEA